MDVMKSNEQKTMFTPLPSVMSQSALLIPSVMVTKENLFSHKQKMIYDLSTTDYDPLLDNHLLNHNSVLATRRPINTSERKPLHTNNNGCTEPVVKRSESKQRNRTTSKRSRRRKRIILQGRKGSQSPKKSGKTTPFGKAIRKGLSSPQKLFPSIDITSTTLKNIKFWRGTTPIDRNSTPLFPPITIDDSNPAFASTNKMIAPHEVSSLPLPAKKWTTKLPSKPDSDKTQNRYYERNIALRDRLIEYETMHYREAVTRINRYREKLRQRPLATRGVVTRNGKTLSLENNAATKVHIVEPAQNEPEVVSTSPPGVRMSPSKEWKPYVQQPQKSNIANITEPQKIIRQRRKPTDGSNYAKKVKSLMTLSKGSSTPEAYMSCPILGEKLLRGRTPKTVHQNWETEIRKNENKQSTQDNNLTVKKDGHKQLSIDAQSTKDILVDLRKQLTTVPTIKSDRIDTGRFDEAFADKPRTAVGAKLRLLLHKSSQSDRSNHENEKPDSSENKQPVSRATLKTQPVLLLNKQKLPFEDDLGKNFEPLITEKSLIVMGSKGKKEKTVNKELQRRMNTQTADSKLRSLMTQYTGAELVEDDALPTAKHSQSSYWRRHIAYKKISTNLQKRPEQSATDMQPMASQIQNPTNTRMVETNAANLSPQKFDKQKLIRNTILSQQQTNGYENIRNEKLMQQKAQLHKARQALFDPAKLAVTNFTEAILNSEIGLRAPSSSPVEFLRKFLPHKYQNVNKEQKEFIQFNVPVSRQNTPRSGKTPNRENRFTVNHMDGLSPANDEQMVENFNPLPKVADLIDLQRLYDVMRKHGESFANLPFSHSSPLGDYSHAGVLSHKDKEMLRKQPFYHYPYPYQNPKSIKNIGMPLYVVTGAKAIESQTHLKTKKLQQKPKISNTTQNAKLQLNHTPRSVKFNEVKVFPTAVPIKKSVAVQKDGSDGYEGIRSVTVSMVRNHNGLGKITEY